MIGSEQNNDISDEERRDTAADASMTADERGATAYAADKPRFSLDLVEKMRAVANDLHWHAQSNYGKMPADTRRDLAIIAARIAVVLDAEQPEAQPVKPAVQTFILCAKQSKDRSGLRIIDKAAGKSLVAGSITEEEFALIAAALDERYTQLKQEASNDR